jgi:DNA-directed RNA polymerase subunit RPC12/RpoP
MKDYKCAHCAHCNKIKYDGFFCDKTGYLEHKRIEDKCNDFEADTIETEPVRHGRWINKGEYAVCTECGGRSGTQFDGVEPIALMTRFCPNCGARMDGDYDA